MKEFVSGLTNASVKKDGVAEIAPCLYVNKSVVQGKYVWGPISVLVFLVILEILAKLPPVFKIVQMGDIVLLQTPALVMVGLTPIAPLLFVNKLVVTVEIVHLPILVPVIHNGLVMIVELLYVSKRVKMVECALPQIHVNVPLILAVMIAVIQSAIKVTSLLI